MFYFFSKALAFFLNPMVWISLLLLYALFGKRQRRKKRALITSILILVILGNKPLAFSVFGLWEGDKIEAAALSKTYDHAVILTGNINRLYESLELYQLGSVKKIFISGFPGDIKYTDALIKMGIPADDILYEDKSLNTYQSALSYSNTLDEMQKQDGVMPSSLLITSAYHMKRSAMCFNKQGVVFDEYRVDFNQYDLRAYDYFMPAASALFCWERVLHELVGIIAYKLRGYI